MAIRLLQVGALYTRAAQRRKRKITSPKLSSRTFRESKGRNRRDAADALSVNSSRLNLCTWQVQ